MRPFRLGSLRAGLAALLVVLLAGCLPESKNPVAALDPAQQDPRLWGAWVHVAEDGFSVAHIFSTETKGLEIILVDHDVEGVGGEPETYQAHTTKTASGDYLNVLMTGDETGYLIGKYSFKDTGTLSIAFASDAALTAAVKAGQLAGTIKDEGSNLQDLTITATSQQWQAFLAKAPKDLFADPVEFQRVGPAFVSE